MFFKRAFLGLDQLLRGDATRLSTLHEGRFEIRLLDLLAVILALGAAYGFCLGWFGIVNRPEPNWQQLMAAMVKVPALFLLTFLVTAPSLYVFNALVGSRLALVSMLRLVFASMAVSLGVIASLGPIVTFFAVSTESYGFMVLLNVLVFGVGGVLGLSFLLQTLHRMTTALDSLAVPQENIASAGALEPITHMPIGARERVIFRLWVLIFAMVGAQMAWVLRPFIGQPDGPFTWFRPRTGNFFEALSRTILGLLTGHGS